MLGDLTGNHPAGIVQRAFDADEGDTVWAGDSTKAHSVEPSLATMRAGARSGGTPPHAGGTPTRLRERVRQLSLVIAYSAGQPGAAIRSSTPTIRCGSMIKWRGS